MKRSLLIITLISLSLIFSGCGKTTSVDDDTPTTTTKSVTTAEEPVSTSDSTPAENAPLSDKSLLENLDGQMPESYIMEMVNTVNGSLDGSSTGTMEMRIKTTMMGAYSIMEMSGPMYPAPMVMIYNPDEKATYQYNIGETTGMKYGADSGMEQLFETQGNDMVIDDLDELKNAYGDGIITREESYQGQDVIYIETTDISITEGAIIKMWFSKDYLIPLKYELYTDKQLMMKSEVTHFEANPPLTKSDFQPPSTINFQELEMNFTPATE